MVGRAARRFVTVVEAIRSRVRVRVAGRGTLGLAAVTLMLLVAAAPAQAAVTNTFSPLGDGVWNTAGNWSQGHVPIAGEDVVLARSATLDAGANGVANSISIPVGTGLTLDNGKTLTIGTGTSSIAAGVGLYGGSTLTLNGTTTWSAGFIAFGGSAVASLVNAGSLNVTGADPALIHNVCCSAGLIHNTSTGTITRTSGTGDIAMNVPFDNDGAVTVSTGTLAIGFDGSGSGGSFTIGSGAKLKLNADFGLEVTAQITGAGTVDVAGGTLTVPQTATFSPANLTIAGGTLALGPNSSIPGAFSMTGGARQGTATLNLNGATTISGGDFSGAGATNVAGPATALLNGSFGVHSGHVLTLNGPSVWSAAFIGFGGTGVGTLENNGAMTITGDLAAIHNTCCDAGLIHNTSTGTITRSSGTGDFTMNVPFDNDGVFSLATGSWTIGFAGSGSTGSFALAAGTELKTLADYGLAAGSSVTGAGRWRVQGGSLSVDAAATFTPTDLSLGGGILQLEANTAVPGAFTMSGGERRGGGALTLNGTADITGGALRGPGTTTIATATPAQLGGGFGIYSGHTLNLNVPVTWASGTIGFGGNGVGALVNNSALTLTGDVNAHHDVCCSAGLIHNAGTMTRSTSAGTATLDVPFENAGTLDLQTGTISHPGYSWTQTAGVTNVHAGATLGANPQIQGGTVKGTGTINGDVTNTSGLVAPGASPGLLTVTGNYTQASGGTLDVAIAGLTPGTQFDQLLVGGVASLGGTLALHSVTFTPALTDTFKIIRGASSRTGTFATLTGASTGTGATYSAQYDSDGATLLVNGTPPANTVAPSIPATGHPGDVVTCNPGTWTGAPTFAFAWTRGGTPIAGQTAQTRTLTTDDIGHDLRCRVVGHNVGGDSAPADSNVLVTSLVVTPPTTTPPPVTPAPVQPAAPTTVAITQVATLPSPRSCVSRRLFRIRLRGVSKNRIVAATIKLNGKQVRAVRGSALGLPIDLRGLPKGTFLVEIITTDASGKRVAGKRRYHTCVPKLHG